MITPNPQTSLSNARKYFREHLKVGDYYKEGETVEGEWFGEAATRLNLKGKVKESDFLALCDGNNPSSGETLTARKNTTRVVNGKVVANRRIFHDFVFRPPKSVSIVGLMDDPRIVDLHRAAARTALLALEKFAETRVRTNGAVTDRRTGNIVAALFEHDTSREQDPLIHTHAVIFNATYDDAESRWKALQTHEMYKALGYADSIYNAELARGVVKLGYGIRQVGKSWEIAGVSRELVERFSKRRKQISERLDEEMAKPENANADRHIVRDRIARDERKRKVRGASRAELLKRWKLELGAPSDSFFGKLRTVAPRAALPRADYRTAIEWAKEFVFERKSVVRLHELYGAAMVRLLGSDATTDGLASAVAAAGIVREQDSDRVASIEGLEREWAIVERAKKTRGQFEPLVAAPKLPAQWQDSEHSEQREALEKILGSRDGVTVFRGAAGTGKTYTLREMVAQLEASGLKVRVAAPQAQQAQALVADGIPALTLAKLLHTQDVPTGGIVLIDEAGQVGGRQMAALFDLARRTAARVILSGDTRQHSSVDASDAMRAIESFSNVTSAEIRRIRRQDPRLGRTPEEQAQIRTYREAVEDASKGATDAALFRLKSASFVHEVGAHVIERTADEFMALHAQGFRVLAVSQTRESVKAINAEISDRLLGVGAVRDVRPIEAFAARDLHKAEKRIAETYHVGTQLRMIRAYSNLRRGELVDVVAVEADRLELRTSHGTRRVAALAYSDRWEVVDRQELAVGIGTVLQLRANGVSLDGKGIVNGELVTVSGRNEAGDLRVVDRDGLEKLLGRENRVMQVGYAVTSYGAQGKTVDAVILADSGVAAATNKKQWYVSISRGCRRIAVFTEDVRNLAQRIRSSGDRDLAIEMDRAPSPAVNRPRRGRVDRAVRRGLAALITKTNRSNKIARLARRVAATLRPQAGIRL